MEQVRDDLGRPLPVDDLPEASATVERAVGAGDFSERRGDLHRRERSRCEGGAAEALQRVGQLDARERRAPPEGAPADRGHRRGNAHLNEALATIKAAQLSDALGDGDERNPVVALERPGCDGDDFVTVDLLGDHDYRGVGVALRYRRLVLLVEFVFPVGVRLSRGIGARARVRRAVAAIEAGVPAGYIAAHRAPGHRPAARAARDPLAVLPVAHDAHGAVVLVPDGHALREAGHGVPEYRDELDARARVGIKVHGHGLASARRAVAVLLDVDPRVRSRLGVRRAADHRRDLERRLDIQSCVERDHARDRRRALLPNRSGESEAGGTGSRNAHIEAVALAVCDGSLNVDLLRYGNGAHAVCEVALRERDRHALGAGSAHDHRGVSADADGIVAARQVGAVVQNDVAQGNGHVGAEVARLQRLVKRLLYVQGDRPVGQAARGLFVRDRQGVGKLLVRRLGDSLFRNNLLGSRLLLNLHVQGRKGIGSGDLRCGYAGNAPEDGDGLRPIGQRHALRRVNDKDITFGNRHRALVDRHDGVFVDVDLCALGDLLYALSEFPDVRMPVTVVFGGDDCFQVIKDGGGLGFRHRIVIAELAAAKIEPAAVYGDLGVLGVSAFGRVAKRE